MIAERRAKKSGREIPSSEREATLTPELPKELEELKEMVKEAVRRVEKAEKEVSEAEIMADVAVTIREYLSDGWKYIAEVPEVPSCMADAATYEAMENVKVIIDEWIETAKKSGREILSSEREATLTPELSKELEQLKEMIKEVVRRTEKVEKEASEAETKEAQAIEVRKTLSRSLD